MHISIYYIDTFTDKIFYGNPAAVCVLPKWLPDLDLQAIAKENNQPVTAFLVYENEVYSIRWITPESELELCGHGTLAAAYVIFNFLNPDWQNVEIISPTEMLKVSRANEFISLNLPARNIQRCSLPILEQGLGIRPLEIYEFDNQRCLALYETEQQIKELRPNIEILKQLTHRGIIVTAPGNNVDFVSRTFYPLKLIPEDFVTGASHCLLVPYWAKRLKKEKLHALQISDRVGEIFCEYLGDRVLLSGKAVLYIQGLIKLNK